MKKNILALSLFFALSISVVPTSHALFDFVTPVVFVPIVPIAVLPHNSYRPTGFDNFMSLMVNLSPKAQQALLLSLGLGLGTTLVSWMVIYNLLSADC